MFGRKLLASILFVAFPAYSDAASFQPLGDLPGGGYFSAAKAISADGLVVVGDSNSELGQGKEVFRWSESTGMVALGDLDGGLFASAAYGVSADGLVVVGFGRSANRQEAFRWTESTGMVGLGDLAGLPVAEVTLASATSADGSVVVGKSGINGISHAYRWTESTGMVDFGLPANRNTASASDVSANGSVVVGGFQSTTDDIHEGFIWTEGGGFVGIGDLPGGDFVSGATGVSGDGTVVVGHSNPTLGSNAIRWTLATGIESLGDLPGGQVNAVAWATNFDGSIVVGQSDAGVASPNGDAAFIWDDSNGMRKLQDVLEVDLGLDLTGWTLSVAKDISADGRVITGTGFNPDGELEAWLAVLSEPIPEPTTCTLALAALCLAIGRRRPRKQPHWFSRSKYPRAKYATARSDGCRMPLGAERAPVLTGSGRATMPAQKQQPTASGWPIALACQS